MGKFLLSGVVCIGIVAFVDTGLVNRRLWAEFLPITTLAAATLGSSSSRRCRRSKPRAVATPGHLPLSTVMKFLQSSLLSVTRNENMFGLWCWSKSETPRSTFQTKRGIFYDCKVFTVSRSLAWPLSEEATKMVCLLACSVPVKMPTKCTMM